MSARSSTKRASAPVAPPLGKPVRVTVDLAPGDYDTLREWAHLARMSHSDVLRALLRLLVTDERVAKAVRDA